MEKRKLLKNKKYILPALVVFFVILMATLPFIVDSSRQIMENKASVLSGNVELSSISTTVSGTGTLTDGESVEIELPDGVRLKEYLVNNGDFVKAGDALARVDKVSVMEAISSVQETLSYLEDEMSAVSAQYAESYITSSVSGTVKEVYAQAGDSVRDVMLSHGALAVVSLDGLMALELETDAGLKAGDSVALIFPDKTQKTGTVKSNADGTVCITLPDEGFAIGETVEVKSQTGISLGSAELSLNRSWSATAFTGTVTYTYVSENSSIASGNMLFYITDTSYTGEYELLAKQHRAYEDLLESLFKMYQDESIASPSDGMIWGISDDTVELLSASSESKGFFASLLAVRPVNNGGSPVAALLSNGDSGENPGSGNPGGENPDGENPDGENPDGENPGGENPGGENPDGENPGGENPDGENPGGENPGNEPPADEPSKEAEIVYGKVIEIDPDAGTGVAEIDTTKKEITFQNEHDLKVGDQAIFVYENGEWVSYQKIEISAPGGSDASEMPGDSFGGGGMSMGSMGGGVSVQEEAYELFPLEGTTIMTVTTMDKASVTFSVDELDILSLSKGQEAVVTIDALPGQSFRGLVTAINTSGESRKYSVEVSFDRTEKMLAGYNCSITILTDTKENVASIPVEAQVEIGGHTYVYTDYDKKNDELTEPVEIETGISDGTNVEVDLPEGTEYWYEYYDTAPFSFPF